ncbi:hypothetical protein D3C78_1806660 [compost metagenome]
MQGLVNTGSQQPVGLHGQEHVGRFYAHLELVKVETVQNIHVTHGGFQQRFRRRFAVLFLNIFFQRAAVNADADRDIFVTRTVNH